MTAGVLLWATLGAVIGSHLGTVLSRAEMADEAREAWRSLCEHCGRQLRWFELVPVLSFVFLRGRCRTCKMPLARTQVIIEAGCAAMAAACSIAGWPLLAPLAWMVLVLAFFDDRHLWLPDRLVVALAIAALVAPPWLEISWMTRLIGGMLGFASLWIVARLYRRTRGRDGLGGGDPKMFGALGLWTGPASLPTLLLLACTIGFVDWAYRIRSRDKTTVLELPFGAYLAVATLAMILVKLLDVPEV